MKYSFRDLLTLLMSLFILSSCDNPSLVGLDVEPGDKIQGQLIDSLAIQTFTAREDSMVTTGASQTPFGYLNDPVIGETSSDLAFAVAPLETEDSRIPVNAVIDSAVVVLNYGVAFFGDSLNSNYQLEVKQLNSPFVLGKSYYSTDQWDVKPETIGGINLTRFAYKDSITIRKRIDDKDSVVTVAPQLRIPLNGAKLKSIFDGTIDSTKFANAEEFQQHVKGFYISLNKEAQVGLGGIVHFAISSEENGIEVYYKQPGDTVQTIKRYAMASAQTAAAITHTYRTEVQQQLDNPNQNYATVYAQGIGGLKTVVTFPDLENLKNQDLIINKAELVVYTDGEATGNTFTAQAPRLTLYRKDISGQRKPVPDGDTRPNYSDPRSFGITFGGYYDKEKKRYLFTLTSYIQDILEGKINDSGIYISPAALSDVNSVPYLPVVNVASRAILAGGNHSNNDMKTKLNIYFSKVK